MDQLLTNNVWHEVSKHLKQHDRKSAAIAYATTDLHLRFSKGDVLICDASDAAIKSGETSADLLKKLRSKGVELYSCPGLHAKVLVSEGLAVVGSANLSLSSANQLIETAILSRRFQVRSQVRAFIQKLAAISTPIDLAFVTRVKKLPVAARFKGKSASKRVTFDQSSNKTWIVSTVPLSEKVQDREAKYEETGEEVASTRLSDPESGISWIRWQGKSRFRIEAKEGDSVIELERNKLRNRCRVIQPRPIVFRQDEDKWTRFYLEDPVEAIELPWHQFGRKLRKADIRTIHTNTTRELAPRETAWMEWLWNQRET